MQEVRHRRATRDRDMVGTGLNKGVRLALVMAVALTAAAADAKKKKVTTPPPPPPPTTMKVYVPYKPYPPEYASPNMAVPPLGADGLRTSVNRGISPAQTLWNFRSAYNVAALSCNGAKYATIVPGYRAFLRANAKVLTGANRTVDAIDLTIRRCIDWKAHFCQIFLRQQRACWNIAICYDDRHHRANISRLDWSLSHPR